MEYDHGVRLTPLVHEMTPLERGIQEYQWQVEQYHRNRSFYSVIAPAIDV